MAITDRVAANNGHEKGSPYNLMGIKSKAWILTPFAIYYGHYHFLS